MYIHICTYMSYTYISICQQSSLQAALECSHATRWATTLSSKVNFHHRINFENLCGAHLVTFPSESRGTIGRLP